jgi:hypothetical protein
METAECTCDIYRTSGRYFQHIHLSFFHVRVQWTHMRSAATPKGHYCSDVILLAVNSSYGYRHGAKSGNNGEEEDLL